MLQSVDTVVGYTVYIQLIRPMIEGKQIISSTMTQEVDRVEAALEAALSGKPCAIVSSGDAGIYAMAGLVLEMCAVQRIPVVYRRGEKGNTDEKIQTPDALEIEVVPGIPAVCAGASLLGAPLTHDFACISLSDLLTPWELIEKRLHAAASADFVMAIYNPKSKRRATQLEQAQQIVLEYRSGATPVGVVTSAMRDDQDIHLTTLEYLHQAPVTMLSTVFIGNSTSFVYQDIMITPRGYRRKYHFQDRPGEA